MDKPSDELNDDVLGLVLNSFSINDDYSSILLLNKGFTNMIINKEEFKEKKEIKLFYRNIENLEELLYTEAYIKTNFKNNIDKIIDKNDNNNIINQLTILINKLDGSYIDELIKCFSEVYANNIKNINTSINILLITKYSEIIKNIHYRYNIPCNKNDVMFFIVLF